MGRWSDEQRRFLKSDAVCKDADVLDDYAEYHRGAQFGGTISAEILALSAGVAMYVACDGLTGEEAMAAFRAGKRVRSLLEHVGDLLTVGQNPGFRQPLADAVNGACSDDAHAESALAMMLAGANLPPGQNVYFHCAADDTVVQLCDAFRWGRVNTCITHVLRVILLATSPSSTTSSLFSFLALRSGPRKARWMQTPQAWRRLLKRAALRPPPCERASSGAGGARKYCSSRHHPPPRLPPTLVS